MKFSLVTVLLVIAGAHALPQQNVGQIETRQQRIFTIEVRRIIEQISQDIKQAGLDPLEIKDGVYEYNGTPDILEIKAFVDSLVFTGASNIAINKLNINPFISTADFDLSLPKLHLSIVNSVVESNFFGNARLNGSISIKQIRIAGQVNYTADISSGITIKDVTLKFSLGGIESNVSLTVQGNDFSDIMNTYLNITIPDTLIKYQDEINQVLNDIVMTIIQNNTPKENL